MSIKPRIIDSGGGGGGGGGCFTGETLVCVPGGQRRIDEIKEGDQVISFDDKGLTQSAKVLAVHRHENEQVVRYTLWGGEYLDATPNHWVLNQYNAFVEVGSLGPDDCLIDVCNHLRPIVARDSLGKATVYNLTVEGQHTFIANNVRVHNAGLGLRVAGSGGGGGGRSSRGKGGGGSSSSSGGGGGGGGLRKQVTAADNTFSTQHAYVYDLISEGEIEGFVNGAASIFLDNTRLQAQNADGTKGLANFGDVEVHLRRGTQIQDKIPLSVGSEEVLPVGRQMKYNTSVIETISDSEVDRVRVTVNVPSLQVQNKTTGDVSGTTVIYQVGVRYGTGTRTEVARETISGRSGDLYQRSTEFDLNRPNEDDTVEVSLRRLTTDAGPNNPHLQNDTIWSTFTQIKTAATRYANSAVVATRVNAEQFQAIPERKYHIKGIKVRIPNGATVDSDTGRVIYPDDFFWDGTFSAATWCSDPAWVLWDVLTSTRYGFGDHVLTAAEKANFTGNASRLSKYDFFAASKYNNELIPNGFGGFEPRFSCNVSIQAGEEAFTLINNLLSTMRCRGYWSAGSLAISQDRPSDPVFLFSQANVIGDFNYTGSSLKQRSTVVGVSYLDIDAQDLRYEYVEDQEGIAKYGVVRRDVEAFGCTSQGQAARLGRWILYTEKFERDVVGFTCAIDAGIVVRPGDIIQIADRAVSGERLSGRITAVDGNTFTVDSATGNFLSFGAGSLLSVILPDGSTEARAVVSGGIYVDDLYIEESYYAINQLTVEQAYSTQPLVNSIWLLEKTGLSGVQYVEPGYVLYSEDNQVLYVENSRTASDVQPTTWKVVSIEEEDDVNYNVTALSHNPSKYANVETNEPLATFDVTNLNEPPGQVQNLRVLKVALASGETVQEVITSVNGRMSVKIAIAWQAAKDALLYEVAYRHDDDNVTVQRIQGTTLDIPDVKRGNYVIFVTPLRGILRGPTSQITYEVVGASRKNPDNVTGLKFTRTTDLTGILSWDKVKDPSIIGGGKILVNYDSRTSGATWESSNPIFEPVSGDQNSVTIPLSPGTYFVKAETENLDDLPALRSATAAEVVVDESGVQTTGALGATVEESDNFTLPLDDIVSTFTYGYPENLFLSSYTIDPPAPKKRYADTDSKALRYVEVDPANNTTYTDEESAHLMVATELYVAMDYAVGNYYNYDGTGEYVLKGIGFAVSELDHLDGVGIILSTDKVFDLFLRHKLTTTPGKRSGLFDNASGLFNQRRGLFDGGSAIDVTSCRNYIRNTFGNATGLGARFSEWREFTRTVSVGTAFQTKIVLSTGDADSTLSVEQLKLEALMPEEIQRGTGTSGTAVTFDNPFGSGTPTVVVQADDLGTDGKVVLTSVSITGFTATLTGATSTGFSYTATGFGKGRTAL
jgi:predicted phage tail protein